jgi:hypothetical protein
MSEFVFLLRSSEDDYREAMGTPERAQKSLQAWMIWIQELQAKGQLKNPGIPLERTGKTVRGKQLTVTDGPFAEADIVIGFIVVEARDLGGGVEIRPVMSAPF